MINLLGFSLTLPAGLEFLGQPVPAFIINLLIWLLVALLVNGVLLRVLKALTRRLPGEVEDILLGILSRPIVILIVLYGIGYSLRLLPLLPVFFDWVNTITVTVVVLLVTHILGRFTRDIVVYYGSKWAARTETRVDDVIIPILNLFGPLVLALTASLIILPLWGINITSVLLGAGVLGLVLGLALQETLGNIFSGLAHRQGTGIDQLVRKETRVGVCRRSHGMMPHVFHSAGNGDIGGAPPDGSRRVPYGL